MLKKEAVEWEGQCDIMGTVLTSFYDLWVLYQELKDMDNMHV